MARKLFPLMLVLAFLVCMPTIVQAVTAIEYSVLYVCIDTSKEGSLRVVGDISQCDKKELPLALTILSPSALDEIQNRIDSLETTVAEQNDIIADLEDKLANVSIEGDTMLFKGVNVQIVNGLDNTHTINGTGNLIVGYNELRGEGDDRTGSHNIVIGKNNNYSAYGGLVVGYQNEISGEYSSVSGGLNTASGFGSSVSGGYQNIASNSYSSVSGGFSNTASGNGSSVSGGSYNTADIAFSVVP